MPTRLSIFIQLIALVMLAGCNRQSVDSQTALGSLLPQTDTPTRRGDKGSRDNWTKAIGPRSFNFPRDHAAHEDYRIEWWYYTGNLRTKAGRRFGYQLTFFRTGLKRKPENPSRWAVRDLYTAHFALSDVEQEKHHMFQRNNRAGVGQAGAGTQRLEVWNGDWRAELVDDEHRLIAQQEDVAIELTLKSVKEIVLHGDEGLSRKGAAAGNASYYYSFSRLHTSGTVTINGTSMEVDGDSWMDHEFSTSFLEEGQLGWDWFSIQLDNNTEIMLYQMRRRDGSVDPFSSGTFVAANGDPTHLSARQCRIRPLGTWRSNTTGAEYPLRWTIEIPTLDLTLDVEPAFDEQEMTTGATTGIAYWEGSISAQGQYRGARITGTGYLELTGYAGLGLGSLLPQ